MTKLLFSLLLAYAASAATVSSITCSGQTATVNATAHGLIASQGFSLSGTAPTFNSSASTVTTNAFTFVLPTGTACSGFTSGYNAVVPAKQIIEMASSVEPLNASVTLTYLYWFTTVYPNPLPCNLPVTVNDVTTNTGCPVSAYPNASAAENAAIVAGTTVEVQRSSTFPANTTATAVEAAIVTQYTKTQLGFSGFLLTLGYCYTGAWAVCQ